MSILVMVDRSQWNITRLKTNFVQENVGDILTFNIELNSIIIEKRNLIKRLKECYLVI